MTNMKLLKDVFTPGGQPSVTYVSRDHLGLEKRVRDALTRGFAINVVTGPTKSGKTVLCNHVLGQIGNTITIEGGQVRSEGDFWEQIVHELDLGSQRVMREVAATNDNKEGGLTLSPGGLGLNAKRQQGSVRTHERAVTYTLNAQRAALRHLEDSRTSLLVDDFHYIEPDVQKAIIRALKGAVFKGLAVILLAVPHRAFDPMTVEQEVEGRFKHIEIPEWSMEDLLLIPERGFKALNVEHTDEVDRKICEEGFGNPLLVQEICSELCIASDIHAAKPSRQNLVESELPAALNEIAKSKGFPKYSRLRQGPDANKKRMLRIFKDGRRQDKYSAILTALAAIGPQQRTKYEDLRISLQNLLEPASMPAKHEVTSALKNMSSIAKSKIEGEPPLEWVEGQDEIVITDPFLLFYMKWAAEEKAIIDALE